MENQNNFNKLFINFASCLGILEGLVFGILALICIVLYIYEPIEVDRATPETRTYIMYILFLIPDMAMKRSFQQVISPKIFTIFMWVYLILNTFWVVTSVHIIRSRPKASKSMLLWGILVLTLSFWDLITVILIGIDLGQCLGYARKFKDASVAMRNCANGMVPVLIIAAKGFVLWIINIALAGIMFKTAIQQTKGSKTVS